MPTITVNFQNPLNTSVQIGDVLYYSIPLNNQSGANHPIDPISTAPQILGIITNITHGIAAMSFTNIGNAISGVSTIALSGIDNDIIPGLDVSGVGVSALVDNYDNTTSILTISNTTFAGVIDEILTFTTTPSLEVSTIEVDNPLASTVPGAYYFFSKDNSANLTSLAGYYAEVEIRNNSTVEAEMFRITSDFSQSSR